MKVYLDQPDGIEGTAWGSITNHLDRLNRAIDTDKSLVIGCAKELVEAIAKAVLDARGQTAPVNTDFQKVVNKAHSALKCFPGDQGLDPAVRDMTSLMTKIMSGLGDLRNRVGTGHGRAVTPEVTDEMAWVAVDAARGWSRWALRRLGHLLAESPQKLAHDLREGRIFYRDDLAARLRDLKLPELSYDEQHAVGLAVGQRAGADTRVVMDEGVNACAHDRDTTTWPDGYRAGVAEGLFISRAGYLQVTAWAAERAAMVLREHPDAAAVLEGMQEDISQAAWSYRREADEDGRNATIRAVRENDYLFSDAEARQRFREIADLLAPWSPLVHYARVRRPSGLTSYEENGRARIRPDGEVECSQRGELVDLQHYRANLAALLLEQSVISGCSPEDWERAPKCAHGRRWADQELASGCHCGQPR